MSDDLETPQHETPQRRPIWAYVTIGLLAGFLSGLFGIGGGIVIVPLLVLLAHVERKRASGTSLAAIVPSALVGVASYAVGGHVDWLIALILVVGSVVGAQVGAWLLHRLPVGVIRWAFIAFLAVVAVNLFLAVPSREAELALTAWPVVGLVALGFVTGVLSGILGVGGGIVVVPMLILLFGQSDLVAKGTSLAMMIPTALSGTIGNLRRKNVDLVGAGLVGVSACVTTALGAALAAALDPQTASIVFAAFLVVLIVRLVVEAVQAGRTAKAERASQASPEADRA
ncbi:sulfite exporter TauE/SafE family protein [Agrococcus sp. SL85]|uniref:sulfite exporter TauE/SafE family protein n=1 Tax=Agrococcus sp. SL85 TaxID=2995141 RepID=UPI00226C88BE|nr:sulfite exporter TauE/SafE family protein [Agrococcus sp. SL85]WAC66817.1 sulfite exporter TauE/SafE family protein [Agrococcus sp. SL85]